MVLVLIRSIKIEIWVRLWLKLPVPTVSEPTVILMNCHCCLSGGHKHLVFFQHAIITRVLENYISAMSRLVYHYTR